MNNMLKKIGIILCVSLVLNGLLTASIVKSEGTDNYTSDSPQIPHSFSTHWNSTSISTENAYFKYNATWGEYDNITARFSDDILTYTGDVSLSNFQSPYSYIIWTNGTHYYAMNGTTECIDYSGTNFTFVIENAIDKTVWGGKIFFRNGIYDVSNGKVIIINKPISLIGEGWAYNDTSNEEYGTIISNVGAVENTQQSDDISTIFKFMAVNPSLGNQMVKPQISNIIFKHEGTSFAIIMNYSIKSNIFDCGFVMNGVGYGGIKYEGASFFSRMDRCWMTGFVNYGIIIDGTGSCHVIQNCHIQTNSGTNPICIEVRRNGVTIDGGQINVGSNKGINIYFNNTQGVDLYGGIVTNINMEGGAIGIAIDHINIDTYEFKNILIEYCRLEVDGTGVIFGDAQYCTMTDPYDYGGTILCNWTSASAYCGIIGNGIIGTVAVNGSSPQPFITNVGHYKDGLIATLTTDANLTVSVEYGIDHNSPVFHNGANWYYCDSVATFSP